MIMKLAAGIIFISTLCRTALLVNFTSELIESLNHLRQATTPNNAFSIVRDQFHFRELDSADNMGRERKTELVESGAKFEKS